MSSTSRKSENRLSIESLEDRLNLGTGTFTVLNGADPAKVEFNFSVAVMFDATPIELQKIKNAILEGSRSLKEATDGQHQFGLVTFVNNSGSTTDAEVIVVPTSGDGQIATGTFGAYGIRGFNVVLYYDRAVATQTLDEAGITVAHEFGHHLYGLGDHYVRYNRSFSGKQGETQYLPAYDLATLQDFPDREFSLMDRPLARGGRLPANLSKSGQITQREFTVDVTHQRELDHVQNSINRTADGSKALTDWETVVRSSLQKGYPITMPELLPSNERYPDHTIRIADSDGHSTVAIVLDRSGSITPDTLNFAQNAARLVVRYLNPADRVAIVSFADEASVDTKFLSAADTKLFEAINKIQVVGGTNITDALEDATDLIDFLPQADRTPSETILLLTDGDNTTDIAPTSKIALINTAGVSVFSVGLGSQLSVTGRQTLTELSNGTKGYGYFADSNLGLFTSFFRAAMAIKSYATLGVSGPMAVAAKNAEVGSPEQRATFSFEVSPKSKEAIFALAQEDEKRTVNFLVTSPTGRKFTVVNSPNTAVTFVEGAIQSIAVTNPEAGTWRVTATSPESSDPNPILFLGSAARSALAFTTQIEVPQELKPGSTLIPSSNPTPPATIIRATVTANGSPVFGATVTARVTRPDGTFVSVPLMDDGLSASRDTLVDGTYSAAFSDYSSKGVGAYQFDVMVDTKNGKAMAFPSEGFPLPPGSEPLLPQPVESSSQTLTDSVVLDNIPELPGGFVSGRVFDDLNSNRRLDTSEPGIADVLVYPDFNNNSQRDSTEPFAITGADGTYTLEITEPGRYTIQIQLPEGKTLNTDAPVAAARGNLTTSGVDFSLGDPNIPPPEEPSIPSPVPPTVPGVPPVVPPTVPVVPPVVPPISPPPGPSANGKRFAVATGGADRVSIRGSDGVEISSVLAFDGTSSDVRAVLADFNNDGVLDLVAGTGPGVVGEVRVFDGVSGKVLFRATPYESEFQGGIFVAAGDVTGDGRAELIVTPGVGGGPRVIVYDGTNFAIRANFFWLEETLFRGGATAAVGDLDNDGKGELMIGAGVGGGPRVATFRIPLDNTVTPTRAIPDFFAFEPTLRSGVFLAAGNLNSDTIADIAVSAGVGGSSRISVFSGAELMSGTPRPFADFLAGPAEDRGGARVAVRDLVEDDSADLIVGLGQSNRVVVFSGANLTASAQVATTLELELENNPSNGVFVG
jgi:uncharacterized protein YegL